MKTTILNLMTVTAFFAVTALEAQEYNLKPEVVSGQSYHVDGIVSDISDVPTNNPYLNGHNVGGVNSLKIGASASGGQGFTTSAIIPFKLPELPSGKTVLSANLKVHVNYGREWISSNVDLYGLTYNSASTIYSANHYDDAYPDGTVGVTAIEDDYFAKNVGTGNLDTPRFEETEASGDAALVAYLNAQYTAGAVAGDYVFLRLNVDNPATTGAHYFGIDDGSTANAPTLTFEIGDSGEPVDPEEPAETTYNINPTGDGIISDITDVPTSNPYLTGNDTHEDGGVYEFLKVGNSASTGAAFSTNAILPFELPARPSGKSVVGANLKVNIAYQRHWISSDIDLYGLPYNASNTIYASDIYDGTFANPQGSATGIQDAFFVRTEATGAPVTTDVEVNSNAGGDTALVAYLNAQYDAGAEAGDYVFLRLGVDATSGEAAGNYYAISDESSGEAPVLTIEIDSELSVESIDRSALTIYPNPNKDGQLKISLEGFNTNAALNIYAITGQLMQAENIEVNSGDSYTTTIHLESGVYIVKVQEGNVIKTQKLIVE